MGVLILIVLVIVIIYVAKIFISLEANEKRKPDMDQNGNIRCKMCGCSSFISTVDHKGDSVMKCANCGYSWKVYDN